LQNLRLEVIQGFVRDFEEELSNKTLHNIVTLLKVMLVSGKGSSAIKQGYIRHDPTLGLELPTLETGTIIPPTQDIVWKLINVASFFERNADTMIHLGAFTGVRRGELLALQFGDVDRHNKEILINKALT
jgi:integrase